MRSSSRSFASIVLALRLLVAPHAFASGETLTGERGAVGIAETATAGVRAGDGT